jgi:hypothetical protein
LFGVGDTALMSTDIYIYGGIDDNDELERDDLEDALSGLLKGVGRLTGAGCGVEGFNVDLSLADGEDLDSWVGRLAELLQRLGAGPSTFFEVYPPLARSAGSPDLKIDPQLSVPGRSRRIGRCTGPGHVNCFALLASLSLSLNHIATAAGELHILPVVPLPPVPQNPDHPMSDEKPKTPSDADKELEREIRAERKFSLSEAIGRMAGPGMMKGVSPVAPKQQAEAAIEEYVHKHLPDSAGVLRDILIRDVKESDLLLDNFDRPLTALENYVRRVLDSEYLLKELVREADVEWGHVFGERPFFEQEGLAPNPDDPYTHESVRESLRKLLEMQPARGESSG